MGRPTRGARRGAVTAALVALAITGTVGCSSEQANPGTTLPPVTSSATLETSAATGTPVTTSESSTPSAAVSTVISTPSAAAGSSEASSEPSAASSDAPWAGLELTDAQVADAEAALAAYRGYVQAVDAMLADPTKDWSKEANQFAAEAPASEVLAFMARPTVQSGHGIGRTKINPKVFSVEPSLVVINDCVDSTDSTFVDSQGNSLLSADVPGSFRRHPAMIQVGHFDDGRWLVAVIVNDVSTKC